MDLVLLHGLLEQAVFVGGSGHPNRHSQATHCGLVDLQRRSQHPALGNKVTRDISNRHQRLDVDRPLRSVELDDPPEVTDVDAV